MKTYTREELDDIIKKHIKWIGSEEGGERADLSGADLSRSNWFRANLSGANLSGADLSMANLSGAYLSCANLSEADLSGANLSGADLSCANLYGADLYMANLSEAKTKETYFEPQSRYRIMHREDGMIKIGCKEKTITEWDAWFMGDEEYETKRGTYDFKLIHAHYLAVRSYVLHMKGVT